MDIINKKVGILTFQNTLNYGAHLQAYSLCRTIRKLGCECDIIDYRNENISNVYALDIFKHCNSVRSFLQHLLLWKCNARRKRAFDDFLFSSLSVKSYTVKNILKSNDIYSTFIVGSDQVWNIGLTGNDKSYFLDFAFGAKYSYAASFGKLVFAQNEMKDIVCALQNFEEISVREHQAVDLVRKNVQRPVIQSIDPVFLLDQSEWFLLASKAKRYRDDKEYVLLYTQGRPVLSLQLAKFIAEREGLKLKVIHGYARNYPNMFNIKDASIEEFLYLFSHAKHIITTSFHGMAFAIIFNKSFFYEEKSNPNSADSRLESLANLFGLTNRKVHEKMCLSSFDLSIDYKKINDIIMRERNRSFMYLKKILIINK